MSMSEFRVPGEGETLGKILEMLGDGRFKVICADGQIRVARLPGRLRKKLWLKAGDYVIVALWDFDPDKGDIVHKYEKKDIEELKKRGFAEAIENLERYA
jgi:translation initiation factor 1A